MFGNVVAKYYYSVDGIPVGGGGKGGGADKIGGGYDFHGGVPKVAPHATARVVTVITPKRGAIIAAGFACRAT